jgi:hypothetical protein
VRKFLIFYCFFTFLLFFVNSLRAESFSHHHIPDVLIPWVDWVLEGHEEYECPFSYDDEKKRYCFWPGFLSLRLNTKGGHFQQSWKVWNEGWLLLPGSYKHWPQDVNINGEAAIVSEYQGSPAVWVKAGDWTVSGSFSWIELPRTLTIARDTALILLTVNGQTIDFPDWTDEGTLWLKPDKIAQDRDDTRDKLNIKVYRRIIDDIPLKVITRINLNVSGTNRDVLLEHVFLDNFIPLSLKSPLPARIETKGELRIQVRPGQWTVTGTARHKGPAYQLSFMASEGIWPDQEVWVFESLSHLRLVEIQGVTAIDPQQTSLPDEWRHLPAYIVRRGDTMKIIEKKRGNPDPAPDSLTLDRKIWLDFDGSGYTIKDTISGTMSQSWRLEMNPPLVLGRVSVDGQDRFITRRKDSHRAGVEVRRGQINLVADSRLEDKTRNFSIVGWNHDFQNVSAEVHLPPGWRLISTTGVDNVPQTWLKKWTLLDIFIILIAALTFARLKNWPLGVLALITLALIYHEPGAPRWVWLHILASSALLSVLPKGRAWRTVKFYWYISMASLIIISIPFMVNQVRKGLYPQLEFPWHMMGQIHESPGRGMPEKRNVLRSPQEEAPSQSYRMPKILPKDKLDYSQKQQEIFPQSKQALIQYDPDARIQTGPGLPQWQWKKITMKWNGPVKKHEKLSLFLIPPRVIMIILFIQVIVLSILILSLFKILSLYSSGLRGSSSKGATAVIFIIVVILSSLPGKTGEADIPSPKLLKELENRLLEKPDCLPHCASSPRLGFEILPHVARLLMEIHCYDDVAVPLPGNEKNWLPQRVFLNGEPAEALLRSQKGNLYIALPQGIHQILMEGSLNSERQEIPISLPLMPHRAEVSSVTGWYVEGIHENGVVDEQIYLKRISEDRNHKSPLSVEGTTLPPFVFVERTLILGLIWEVETRVVRVSPPGSALSLEIPLLQGESLTTENIRVEKGNALINLSSHEKVKQWRSLFEQRRKVKLTAPETLTWTESWKLNVSPIWHVEIEGIPVIHHTDKNGLWLPQWRPWPGESVTLTITRPEGIKGQTVTIDSSYISVTPGFRATDVKLSLAVRSSQGIQHTIILPEKVELQSVSINGKLQPIQLEQGSVTLPLVPGSQTIELLWRHLQGISRLFETPVVNIGSKSVNSHIHLSMPHSRWVLFTGGPSMGPAVLFWGVIIVIVLISNVLGRVKMSPLKTYQWLLLGIGLTQAPVVCAFIVAGWFFALSWRKQFDFEKRDKLFDLTQIGLTFLTLMALISLFYAIKLGLLGHPDMQIGGNGSTAYSLRWFQDISESELPEARVFSVPLMVYRILMLIWSLWLSFALLRWLPWGWSCFSEGGLWRTFRIKRKGNNKI